jgi:hypothetical protein
MTTSDGEKRTHPQMTQMDADRMGKDMGGEERSSADEEDERRSRPGRQAG